MLRERRGGRLLRTLLLREGAGRKKHRRHPDFATAVSVSRKKKKRRGEKGYGEERITGQKGADGGKR